MILNNLMIASEKSHQNLSDYNQFLFKKDLKFKKKTDFSIRKMRNSGNCGNDYDHSFFVEGF